MNRRSFIRGVAGGLLVPAAPAIVRADSLMRIAPVHDPVMAGEWLLVWDYRRPDGARQVTVRRCNGRPLRESVPWAEGLFRDSPLEPGYGWSVMVRR